MRVASNRKDISEQYFGLLKVLCYYDTIKSYGTSRARYLCECACGNFKVLEADHIKTHYVKSCGCLSFRHHLTGTKLYTTWKNYKARYPKDTINHWGNFEAFKKWAYSSGFDNSLFLNFKEYAVGFIPDNCFWDTSPMKVRRGKVVSSHNKLCKWCGSPLTKRQTKFCNTACQNEKEQYEYITKWKEGKIDGGSCNGLRVSHYIRNYLIQEQNNSCSLCGWNKVHPITGKVPLEIDHIDGDHKNNKEENLRVLCPNCHSLTPHYRALNKGNGRDIRRNNATVA